MACRSQILSQQTQWMFSKHFYHIFKTFLSCGEGICGNTLYDAFALKLGSEDDDGGPTDLLGQKADDQRR